MLDTYYTYFKQFYHNFNILLLFFIELFYIFAEIYQNDLDMNCRIIELIILYDQIMIIK